VIDGDTLVVTGRRTVRLLGVDTPERDESFYTEAGAFLRTLTRDRDVRLDFCPEERRDKYGRLLAFVEGGGMDAGAGLLDQGLAKTLFVGSCARHRAPDYRRREREAFQDGRGIWSLQDPRRVDHLEAGKYVGWMMTVTGTVRKVFTGPRAVHLNFGQDYRTDFTAVIFRKDLFRLSGEGLLLPVTGYQGRKVAVTGVIKEYHGPEIIVRTADQIDSLPK
jgi:micrococcal nuclease